MGDRWWHGWRLPKRGRWRLELGEWRSQLKALGASDISVVLLALLALPIFFLLGKSRALLGPVLFLPWLLGGLRLAAAGPIAFPFVPNNVVTGFGADPTGSRDSVVQIQAALTNASPAGSLNGNQVFLPPGVYKLSAPLTIPQNVKLFGAGQGISILAATTSGAATIIVAYGSPSVGNNTLTDFSIDGAMTAGTPVGHGISLTNAFHVVLDRLSIQGLLQAGQNGIQAVNIEDSKVRDCLVIAKNIGMNFTSNSNNVTVDGCDILNPATGMTAGIVFDNTTVASLIIGTNFEGAGATPGGIGLQAAGTLGLSVIGNFFENWATAAISATTGVTQALYVVGNALHATNAAVAAILYSSAGPNNGLTVQNNFFIQLGLGGSVGIGVDLGTTTGQVWITGNRCPNGADALMVRVNGQLQSTADYVSSSGVMSTTGPQQDGVSVLVWGAAPAVNLNLGNYFKLTATTNIAATIAVPTLPPTGTQLSQLVTFAIFNNSGGALTTPVAFAGGAGGFLASGGVSPANGLTIEVSFRYDQGRARLIEVSRGVAV